MLVLLAFLRAMTAALGVGPRAFIARLFAARFAPLYGMPADLTGGRAADAAAAAAAEEGGGTATGWSLEQVAACLVAPPREGAPEVDGALRAAIAVAAACQQADAGPT